MTETKMPDRMMTVRVERTGIYRHEPVELDWSVMDAFCVQNLAAVKFLADAAELAVRDE